MIRQSANKLGIKYEAMTDDELYKDLFKRRLNGEKLSIGKGMEESFLKSSDKKDKAIGKLITQWHENEVVRIEIDLAKQETRLEGAEKAIKSGKVTKKAQEDVRIATSKIEKHGFDLERHKDLKKFSESDSRIYPFHYLSMLTLDSKGNRVIMPIRYHMRPHTKDESFDRQFFGCYNARLDSLSKVSFWREAIEERRGVIFIQKFYENVDPKIYAKKHKLSKQNKDQENLVVCFEPKKEMDLIVPVVWDIWEKKGMPTLYSGALITDEPLPEVSEAGHDRTPICLKESAIDAWLTSKGDVKELKEILQERERPVFSHEVVA